MPPDWLRPIANLPNAVTFRRFVALLSVLAFGVTAAPALQAETPAPTMSSDANLSPQVQTLEADFLALWPALLRGEFKAGLPLLESLVQQSQSQLGASAASTLKFRYFLGSVLHRMGRLAEAKASFTETLQLHEEAGTQDSRSALGTQAALARVVEDLDSPRAALPLYEDAMAQRRRTVGDDDLESVTLLDDYAGALVEVGQVHAALPLLDQALQMRTRELGTTHRWTLTTLNNRANAFVRLGRYAEALADSETVLRMRMQTLGERDPTTLVAMNITGTALASVGRLEEALVLHERAAALRAELLGPNHPSTLSSRRALADDLLLLGRAGDAQVALLELARQGASAWGPAHRSTLSARVLLARSHELLGEHAAALAELDALLALQVQALGADHFDTLSAGIQRARVLRLLDRAPEACSVLLGLVPVIAERYGQRMAIYAEGVAELAACDLETQAPARAAAALAQLLAKVGTAPDTVNPDDSGANADQERRRDWQRMRVRAQTQQADMHTAFALLEASKSERLLASLGERAAADSAGVTRLEMGELQDHRERVMLLRDATRTARLPKDRQNALQALDQAVLAMQTLQTSLRQRYPMYRQLTQLPAAGTSVAGQLPPRALLVSFMVEAGQHVGAFTVNSQGRVQWHPLGARPGLAQTVESLRLWATQLGNRRLADDRGRVIQIVRWDAGAHPRWRAVTLDARTCSNSAEAPGCRPLHARKVDSTADYDELRQHLASFLLAPLRQRLEAHPHWVLSPDNGLGALPWDVLPWRGGFVAQHARISQVASLASLAAMAATGRTRQARRSGMALLAIGSPNFRTGFQAAGNGQAARNEAWAPLPAAAAEMQGAAAQFRGRRTLVSSGLQATEAQLRSLSVSGQLAQARYLLIATHAWYEPSRPGRSHLAFGATGPGPTEDGRISATELAGLDLRSELTVISACNTARGDAASVDGQFGFAYGLALAGNRNALLTLWPVGDDSSAAFVTRFFHHLARNPRGQVQALYATKREFMQHPRKAWRHPRVWAGFVLFGV